MQLITVNKVIDQLFHMSDCVVSPSAEEHVYLSDLSSKEISVGEALDKLAEYELSASPTWLLSVRMTFETVVLWSNKSLGLGLGYTAVFEDIPDNF